MRTFEQCEVFSMKRHDDSWIATIQVPTISEEHIWVACDMAGFATKEAAFNDAKSKWENIHG